MDGLSQMGSRGQALRTSSRRRASAGQLPWTDSHGHALADWLSWALMDGLSQTVSCGQALADRLLQTGPCGRALKKPVKKGEFLKKPAAAGTASGHATLKKLAAATHDEPAAKKVKFSSKDGWTVFRHTRSDGDRFAGQKYFSYLKSRGQTLPFDHPSDKARLQAVNCSQEGQVAVLVIFVHCVECKRA